MTRTGQRLLTSAVCLFLAGIFWAAGYFSPKPLAGWIAGGVVLLIPIGLGIYDTVVRRRGSAAEGRRAPAITVVQWVEVGDIPDGAVESCGGLGGWVDGETWGEYLSAATPRARPYLEALRQAILRDNLRIGGDDHQHTHTPVFSDGTIGGFSFRAWGDLCAAIYNSKEETRRYGYMDFYMNSTLDWHEGRTAQAAKGGGR